MSKLTPNDFFSLDCRDLQEEYGNDWKKINERQMLVTYTISSTEAMTDEQDSDFDDGVELDVEFPFVWSVCDLCEGRGKYVNPSIDYNGLSDDDFRDDPSFADDYFNGVYDVTCGRCQGRTTIPEVNVKSLNEEQKKLWEIYLKSLEDEAHYRAIVAAERRMGA